MSSADPPAEIIAPPTWSAIDFISDLHLAEETPRTFEAWARYLVDTTADAVLILGDLFEAWIGDDARAEGLEARGAAVLRQAASQRMVGFMVGNRDFLLGRAMLDACGVAPLADPTVVSAFGTRVLLVHGDALCLGDVEYQQFRAVVRGQEWQNDFLSRPIAERRAMARAMRAESKRRKAEAGPWYDVDGEAAVGAMKAARAPTLVHGHTHRPASEALAPDRWRHVLSDWDHDSASPPRAQVLRWDAAGFHRITPEDAVRRPA